MKYRFFVLGAALALISPVRSMADGNGSSQQTYHGAQVSPKATAAEAPECVSPQAPANSTAIGNCLSGAASGALVGAASGAASSSATGEGAVVGAVAGAAAGAVSGCITGLQSWAESAN